MNPDDFDKFGVLLSILQETFSPDKPISKERTKIYFEIFSDIPIENMELGIKELMNTKIYPNFPLPSEIRKAAGFDREDDLEVKALEAFREACDFVYTYGQSSSESQHENALTEEAVRLCFGGWENFKETDPKNENWDRKNFVDVYKRLFQSRKREKLLSTAELMKQLEENRKEIKTLEEKK